MLPVPGVPGPRLNPKLFDRRIRTALGLSIDEPKVYFHQGNLSLPGRGGKLGPSSYYQSEAYLNQLLASALFKSVQTKKAIKSFHDSLEDFYLLRVIKQSIYHDVFYKFLDEEATLLGLPIKIEASSRRVLDRIVGYLEELRVPEIVREILDMTLYLGEYLLFYDKENFQIDETLIDQTSWRAVYQRGRLAKLIAFSSNQEIDRYRENALIFRIKYLPYKLNVLGEDEYPFYAYIGQGIIDVGILNLLNTIRLMESLMPIQQALSVQAGQLVYVRLPEAPSGPKEGFDLARQYERLLNAAVEVSAGQGPVSYQDIISSIAKWRVIPLFGEKGVIEPRELPRPGPIDMQALGYVRQALSDAIPLPASYLGIQEQNEDRNKLAQYYMLITEIRRGIAEFVELVIEKAIAGKKGISGDYRVEPIQVSGILENQMGDYFDLAAFVTDAISRTILSLADIKDRSAEYVNLPVLAQAVNRIFAPLTGGEPVIFHEKIASDEGGFEEPSPQPEEEGPEEQSEPSFEEEPAEEYTEEEGEPTEQEGQSGQKSGSGRIGFDSGLLNQLF